MREQGRPPLGPFALYILRPAWIGEVHDPRCHQEVAWQAVGVENVPIVALRGGFMVFEFNAAVEYSGGDVPAYTLDTDRRIPTAVTTAEKLRDELAYRRFVYMNAFLLALYSGISTVQKRGTPVQEPVDPTNYFGAKVIAGGWETYSDLGRKFDYPTTRSDHLKIETLDHTNEILHRCFAEFGKSSLELLDLVYIACHQYTRHQFASAHLLAWSAVESMLNVLWLRLQRKANSEFGGHTKFNAERRNLLNGRDYTASIISQILSLCGDVDDNLLSRLDEARRRRNSFAHGLERIKSKDAGSTLRLATDLLTKIAGIRVTCQLSLSFWL